MTTGAVRVQPAFDDPDGLLGLIGRSGPYFPLARNATSQAERLAAGGTQAPAMFVPPWFRSDYATHGEVHTPGSEQVFRNPSYIAAAHELFGDGVIVVPTTLYVNVMAPCTYPFVPHIDVPVFVGASRMNCPVWLLHQMLASGLFEAERVRIATAVSWFYGGPGGTFYYWPDGPDGEPRREEAPFGNVAVVADNERVYHGVGPLGSEGAVSPTSLSIDAEMAFSGDSWHITDGDEVIADYASDEVRITVSWKAEVHADRAAQDRVDQARRDDLVIDDIVDRFVADLSARNVEFSRPDDPLTDDVWIRTLAETYEESAPRVPR